MSKEHIRTSLILVCVSVFAKITLFNKLKIEFIIHVCKVVIKCISINALTMAVCAPEGFRLHISMSLFDLFL